MIRVADLFCGAGGETTGIMQALASMGERHDVAAVNHWDIAIETHKRNHPEARTYCIGLEQLDPLSVFGPRDPIDLLWASPECTHHSNAHGGRPCSDQSRASAWLILKWLSELYVRNLIIENVPEFVNWGPLGSDGRPLKSGKGKMFAAFVDALKALGYKVDWQLLCAADYGDPTTRTRFFLQAVRGRSRISWPNPTHAREPGLFALKPWRPAREIIDWNLRGESIIHRKRPLAPATMARIRAGIRRYWGEWAEPFLLAIDNRSSGDGAIYPTSEPLRTIVTKGRFALVEPFLTRYNGGDNRNHTLGEPLPVQDCSNRYAIVEPFLVPQFGEREGQAPRTHSIGNPLPAVTSHGAGALVEPFLVKYYGSGESIQPARFPLSTITTKDRFGLVQGFAGLDVTLRMLAPHELAAAQGFPAGYDFAGNQSEQVKQIGNSVPPGLARALALEALSA